MYVEELNARQQAHKERREAMHAQVLDTIRSAGTDGITRKELAHRTCIGRSSLNAVVSGMHRSKLIHVCGLEERGTTLTEKFAVGDLPNVKRGRGARAGGPVQRRGKRQEAPQLEDEQAAKIEAHKRHQRWAKTWVPHADPAAAWLLGEAM